MFGASVGSLPSLRRRSDVVVDNDPASDSVSNWLFLVADGQSDLAASAEAAGRGVYVARFDPLDSTSVSAVVWTLILDGDKLSATTDVPTTPFVDSTGAAVLYYDGFADHWHIYAHGYHWIAASITMSEKGMGVMLVKFTLDTAGVPTVEWKKVIKEPDAAAGWNAPDQLINETNDLFMAIAGNGGVAVGVRHTEAATRPEATPPDPGMGHTIIEVWGDGTVQPEIAFTPVGYEHANCASAVRVLDGSGLHSGLTVEHIYRVLAPEVNMALPRRPKRRFLIGPLPFGGSNGAALRCLFERARTCQGQAPVRPVASCSVRRRRWRRA